MLNPISPFSPTSPLQALLSLQEQLYPAVVTKLSDVGDLGIITEHEGFIVLANAVPPDSYPVTHSTALVSEDFITFTATTPLVAGKSVVISGVPPVTNTGGGQNPFDLNRGWSVRDANGTSFTVQASLGMCEWDVSTSGLVTVVGSAWTLGAPIPGAVNEGGDDGKLITFISPNNALDTITISGLATGQTTAAFQGIAGAIFTMHAYNGLWYVASVSSLTPGTPDVIFS